MDTVFRADIGGARALTFSDDGSTLALGGITNVTNAFAGIGEVVVVLVDWQQNKIKLQLECKANSAVPLGVWPIIAMDIGSARVAVVVVS